MDLKSDKDRIIHQHGKYNISVTVNAQIWDGVEVTKIEPHFPEYLKGDGIWNCKEDMDF